MSRGFVKEDDLEHAGTDLPERPISPHANYVTPAGHAQLEAEMKQLDEERKSLSSRQEDPVANQRLAVIERDLRYLSQRLESAILVDPAEQDQSTILFGAQVTVEDEMGEPHLFIIVGEDEADIALHKVSYLSPVARALIGRKIGDTVIWARPAGNIELYILNIQY